MSRACIGVTFIAIIASLLCAPGAPCGSACAWAQTPEAGLSADGIGIDANRDIVLAVFKEKYQIVREYIDHLTGVGLLAGAPGKPEDYASAQRIAGFFQGKLFVYVYISESDLKPEQYAKWVADFQSRFGAGSSTPPEFLTSSALWADMSGMFESETAQAAYWVIPENKYVLFAAYDEDGGEGGFFLVNVPVMDLNYSLFTELADQLLW